MIRQYKIEAGPIDLATKCVNIVSYPPREYWRWSGDPRNEQPFNPVDITVKSVTEQYVNTQYPVKWPNTTSLEIEARIYAILDYLLLQRKVFLLPPFDKLPPQDYFDYDSEVDFYDDDEGQTTKFQKQDGNFDSKYSYRPIPS